MGQRHAALLVEIEAGAIISEAATDIIGRYEVEMQSIFQLFFLLVLIVMGFGFAQMFLRQGEIADLRQRGTRVAATVTGVTHERRQTGTGVNHMPVYSEYWRVVVEWTDPQTGIAHTFRSEGLAYAPSHQYAPGSPITVLIDPADLSRYYVEIAR